MPFVVERMSVSRRRLARDLARRVAEVEALDRLEPPLAGELRGPLGLRERARLVDLGAAEDAPVARRERLRHRRGGAQDVDDDARPARASARPGVKATWTRTRLG